MATRDADTFGLAVMGDWATIKKCPILNTLVINDTLRPFVAAIHDCKEHMSKAGEKDAVFISNIFMGVVSKYDENSNRVDLFYFDGASNIKRRGRSWR